MSLYPRNLNEYVASMGIPRGPDSDVYLVDPVNGDDDWSGTNWEKPMKTVIAAEEKCVANQHDTVLFLARSSADNPTASIVWDKDYTHLIGVGSYLPGLGNRSRIVMAAATALLSVITISGNGCIFRNLQFGNEKAPGAAAGVAVITGIRNIFENVFFMVPFATDAASFSLKLSGGENTFIRCTIGQTTSLRTGASYGFWMHKGAGDNQRNKFIDCEFLSWSSVVNHVLVYVDVDINNEGFSIQFENCMFWNLNGGNDLSVAIDDNCAVAHQLLMRGQENCVVGCTAVADPLTYVLKAETGTGTQSGMLMATVAE